MKYVLCYFFVQFFNKSLTFVLLNLSDLKYLYKESWITNFGSNIFIFVKKIVCLWDTCKDN